MAEDKYESEELRRLREQVEEARRLRSIMLAQHIKPRSIADIVGELLREHRPGGIITGWENPVITAAQRFANQTFQHAAEWGEMTKLQQELTRLGGPPSVKPSPTPSKPQPIKPKPTPPPAKRGHSPGRPVGANQFPPEQCDELARNALDLRAATPPRPWHEIEAELGVPTKTLRRYIRHLKAREGQ